MNVVFFVTNDPAAYSGGRYYAALMAETLAAAGHKVTVCTNNEPVFFKEFRQLPAHGSIRMMLSRFLGKTPHGDVDVVIVVPQRGPLPWLYARALSFARDRKARVVLLNFESPNWFNAYSPETRDFDLWQGWVEVSRSADMVLSLVAEGTKYAEEFYDETPSHTLFRHCYPAVNSVIADSVEQPPKRKQILCITRTGKHNTHKGGHELIRALCPALRGYTLLLVVGAGKIDDGLLKQLTQRAEKFGARIEVAYRLTDKEKFRRIKESAMMLFLSHFEGFGYPPVESQYCGVPCVVYDLPVLREVSGDGLIYVPPGDGEALRAAITTVIEGKQCCDESLSERIEPQVSFATRSTLLDELIKEICCLNVPAATVSASADTARQWKRSVLRWQLSRPVIFAHRQLSRGKYFARRLIIKVMVILAHPVRRLSPEFVNLVKSHVLKE